MIFCDLHFIVSAQAYYPRALKVVMSDQDDLILF